MALEVVLEAGVMVIVSAVGTGVWGQLWCWERLSGQCDILRLTTRGHDRARRSGSSRLAISATHRRKALPSRSGGKARLGGDLAAGRVQGAGERDPVRVHTA